MAYPWNSGDQLTAADLDDVSQSNLKSLTAIEAVTAGNPVAASLYQSSQITLDFKTQGILSVNGVNTISITVGNNSNRVLVVMIGVESNGGGQATGTIQYNGGSATAEFNATGSNRVVRQAVFVAPATGTHNLVITTSNASTTQAWYKVYSIYNAAQSGTVDNHTESASGAGNTSHTLSIVADGAIAIGSIGTLGGTIGTVTGSLLTADTQSQVITNSGTTSGDTGLSTPLGAGNTVNIQQSNGTATDLYTLISIAPFNAVTIGVQKASSAAAATALNTRLNFLGFARSGVSAGSSVVVQITGIVTGLSGLTTGAEYYLNDTNGTIGTSAGTVSRKVGVALSSTTLLITNQW